LEKAVHEHFLLDQGTCCNARVVGVVVDFDSWDSEDDLSVIWGGGFVDKAF
jgi:hypothetical protein